MLCSTCGLSYHGCTNRLIVAPAVPYNTPLHIIWLSFQLQYTYVSGLWNTIFSLRKAFSSLCSLHFSTIFISRSPNCTFLISSSTLLWESVVTCQGLHVHTPWKIGLETWCTDPVIPACHGECRNLSQKSAFALCIVPGLCCTKTLYCWSLSNYLATSPCGLQMFSSQRGAVICTQQKLLPNNVDSMLDCLYYGQ